MYDLEFRSEHRGGSEWTFKMLGSDEKNGFGSMILKCTVDKLDDEEVGLSGWLRMLLVNKEDPNQGGGGWQWPLVAEE